MNEISKAIRLQGCKKGAKIGIYGANSPEWAQAMLVRLLSTFRLVYRCFRRVTILMGFVYPCMTVWDPMRFSTPLNMRKSSLSSFRNPIAKSCGIQFTT